MRNKTQKILGLALLLLSTSCTSNMEATKKQALQLTTEQNAASQVEPHRYGGWYCPDNLNGFPAVDLVDWEKVPVVTGRMPTKEETKSEASLIYVDQEMYPDAHALAIELPKLAQYYNQSANREELVIIIQAFGIQNDSIVGFRYLNGGNGSGWLRDLHILSDAEIESLPTRQFASLSIPIDATPNKIWDVLTKDEYASKLQATFDKKTQLKNNWRQQTNVNWSYPSAGAKTAAYAGPLFGNYYIQNDYTTLNYSEKFLLIENEVTGQTTIQIVCGPFSTDFKEQQDFLNLWAQEVKAISEQ
jgi:hypothetical protein